MAELDLNNFFGGNQETPKKPAFPTTRPVAKPESAPVSTEASEDTALKFPAAPTTRPTSTDGPVLPDFRATVIEDANDEEDLLTLDDLLNALLDVKGSDLHLKHNKPPMMRVRGEIAAIEGFPTLTDTIIEQMMREIMTDEQFTEFEEEHDLDMSHEIAGRSRFRVNVHRQRKRVGAVIRVIPNEIKNLEDLGMPETLQKFAALPRGLVLVTGPTGSGKSTTLAAIIDLANRTRHDNIITIEDPIEFVHQDKGCIVVQREIGVDTKSFAEALRRALRQDPDIILVGEMRDAETIQTAITAAETGHLVFATLHTQSAATTMSRIIDTFPAGQQSQIRAQLSNALQAIVSQTLIPTLDGKGRVAAVEILINDSGIKNQIRVAKEEQITSAIQTGKAKGMQTLDQHLEELVTKDIISVDNALSKAANEETLKQKLGGEEGLNRLRRRQQNIGGARVGTSARVAPTMGGSAPQRPTIR